MQSLRHRSGMSKILKGNNPFQILAGLPEPKPEPVKQSPVSLASNKGASAVATTRDADKEESKLAGPKKLANPLVWIDLEMTGGFCYGITVRERGHSCIACGAGDRVSVEGG
eukprot:104362-Pelagomonas_calceolata.AAC.13